MPGEVYSRQPALARDIYLDFRLVTIDLTRHSFRPSSWIVLGGVSAPRILTTVLARLNRS